MAATRIFISHRNNDADGDRILPIVASTLQEAGFDVLVDRERLQPGQQWRNEIYTWMGLCHGAVILLSRAARDDSIWVPRETSILLWRKTLDPTFLVVPLYLDGLTEADFKTGHFRDLNLSELQALAHGPPADVAASVATQFAGLQCRQPTPLEEVAEQIASLLEDVNDTFIQRAADRLGIDLGPWDPRGNPRRALALRMLHVGVRRSVVALEILLPHLHYIENGEQILNLIEPSWVDLCAARWVAECAKRSGHKTCLVLNATKFRTAELYVRRASGRPTKLGWPIVAATGVYGDEPVAEVADEIERALVRQFRLEADPFAADKVAEERARLSSLLANRDQERKPVFVVLQRNATTTAEMLADLQSSLPLVTLFLLTGKDLPDLNLLHPADVCFVEPRLLTGSEEAAHEDIDYARSCIRP